MYCNSYTSTSYCQGKKTLRRLRQILHVDGGKLPKQAVYWEVNCTNRKLGRLRKNWIDTMQQDLKGISLTVE